MVENPDRAALVALYEATDGPNWQDSTNWLTGAPLSEWHGVEVSGGRVAGLSLEWNNLTGSVPPELGDLAQLETLYLYSNSLTGSIPPELGSLSRLRVLELQDNSLTGSVPPELGDLAQLESLWLQGNGLTGSVPPELGDLARLEVLDLADNSLTGSFPPEVAQLSNLREIFLPDLVCIPRELSAWASELRVSAYECESSEVYDVGGGAEAEGEGVAPERRAENPDRAALVALYEATDGPNWQDSTNWLTGAPLNDWHGVEVSGGRVFSLTLEWNNLTGSIPPELGDLAQLETLRLYSNSLTGSIPPELGSLSRLRVLELQDNSLTGSVPPELGDLAQLETLYLYSNSLTGSIPPELGSLSRLRVLELQDNSLTGSIPPELGDLARLEILSLDRNDLAGSVPPELGDLAQLESLWLQGNGLTGSVPPELGDLARLEVLDLADNSLTGSFPPEVAQLSNLREIFLPDLVCIPRELSAWASELRVSAYECESSEVYDVGGGAEAEGEGVAPERRAENPDRAALVALYEATDGPNWQDSTNWLTGAPLNDWHGVEVSGGRVFSLTLEWNNLTGSIPPELGDLAQLETLRLYSNSLTGSIPPELGSLSRLRVLELQDNSLTGSVPPELGDLAQLEWLHLQVNSLTGSIPPELGSLSRLRVLELQDNSLTGSIPPELGDLARLEILSLDRNDLAGSIPPELGDLAQLESLWLQGNGLTGSIPPELGDLARLEILSLDGNDLTGSIPPELGDLAQLESLWLQGNGLTGSIPPELGDLARLEILSLDRNDLTGSIPPELGDLARLEILSLDGNDLTGSIPPEVAQLSNLTEIHLPAPLCIPGELSAWASELRTSAYDCESDGRLLPSALMREDSNGLSIRLPDDLRELPEMNVSDSSVVAAFVADGWLELTPRGIGTVQVELVPSDGGAPAVAEVVVRPAVGTFGIDIVMERPAPRNYAEALMTGADWWSRVLDGTEWPDRRAECPDYQDRVEATADELLILADIDDHAEVAGYAVTCFRVQGTQVALDPVGGIITAAPSGVHPHLVVHEIGHILGLVLWGPETGLVSEDGAYFTGPRAVTAFRADGGDPDLPGVPIDGDGSHWCWDCGVYDHLDGAISVAALADAGYTVALTNPEPPSWAQ